MQDNQNFVFRGLDSDNDLRSVKSERYIDGNDIEHFVDETNTLGGIRRMKGTKLGYTIPDIVPQVSNYRIPFITTGNTDYQITLTGGLYYQFSILNVAPDAAGLVSLSGFMKTSLEALPNIGSVPPGVTVYTSIAFQTAALANGAFRLDINNNTTYTITVETRPTDTTEWVTQPFILL